MASHVLRLLLLLCLLGDLCAGRFSRRAVLSRGLGAGTLVGLQRHTDAAAPPCRDASSLLNFFTSTSISPLGAALNPLAPQDLYYPEWMFGAWTLTATLRQKTFPFGEDKVPISLVEGSPRNREEKVGNTVSYEARYFSTLADTAENSAVVTLGLGVPKSRIIADRAFNSIALNKAYNQQARIGAVDWDPRKDPTRLTISFLPTTTADMRPLGPRRVEAYITARRMEECVDCRRGNLPSVVFAEKSRSVMLEPGNVIVNDIESACDLVQTREGRVEGRSRLAVFLTPNPNSREGVIWQEVGGKAVALFDYDISMDRMLDSKVGRPCVETPKGYTQCY